MDLEEKISQLRKQYVAQLPNKLNEISALWAKLRESDDFQLRQDLYRMAHSLAGSGATYGLPDISVAARQMEALVKIDDPIKPLMHPTIDEALSELAEVVRAVTA